METTAQFCSGCGSAMVGARTPAVFHPPVATTRLVRPREGRMVAGVCAGVAQAYGWDVALVRLLVMLSVLFAGLPIVVYGIAWVVMPKEPLALPAPAGGTVGGVGTGSARPGSMVL